MPSRITVAVCVPTAGVGGSGRPLPGGTVFLAISGILFFALVFRLGGAAIVVFPRTGTIVLYMVYCKGF